MSEPQRITAAELTQEAVSGVIAALRSTTRTLDGSLRSCNRRAGRPTTGVPLRRAVRRRETPTLHRQEVQFGRAARDQPRPTVSKLPVCHLRSRRRW
jgi:hypothetical protein